MFVSHSACPSVSTEYLLSTYYGPGYMIDWGYIREQNRQISALLHLSWGHGRGQTNNKNTVTNAMEKEKAGRDGDCWGWGLKMTVPEASLRRGPFRTDSREARAGHAP